MPFNVELSNIRYKDGVLDYVTIIDARNVQFYKFDNGGS